MACNFAKVAVLWFLAFFMIVLEVPFLPTVPADAAIYRKRAVGAVVEILGPAGGAAEGRVVLFDMEGPILDFLFI